MNAKIPGKQSIKDVLKKATQHYKESNCDKAIGRSKKRKGNPAKQTLEEHGINFPRASDSETEESDDLPEVHSKLVSDLSRSMPNTPQEEENRIKLAIQASLHTKHPGFDSNTRANTSNLQPSVANTAAMPMSMFPYDYQAGPNFDYYTPAYFLLPRLPPYYNHRIENKPRFSHSGGQAVAGASNTAMSSQVVKSTNDTTDIPTNSSMTNVSRELPEVSEEAAAMALMTLNNQNK